MSLPKEVTIVEVGPRDGLQNELTFVPTQTKIELIDLLSQTGLKHIEVTSFVSPKRIAQLADSEEVFNNIHQYPDVNYSALVPNEQGLERALKSNVEHIALFTSSSESFSEKNINCSIDESFKRFEKVIKKARPHIKSIRAYISCALGCPYEGKINSDSVVSIASKLKELGATEISFGDTIGVGTPYQVDELLEKAKSKIPVDTIAMHFHDTYGQAIANIYASLQQGIHIFDTSIAGLGGCPYANGATGNVATEDVLYLLKGLNIKTNVDLIKCVYAGDFICKAINQRNQSKVAKALLS